MTIGLRGLICAALAAALAAGPALAQDYYRAPPLRYGNTSSVYFDARNDDRDFPVNSFFPGSFAADPLNASIGAAGFLESNPRRSPLPYPSQVYFGLARDRTYCSRRYRSYDPATGTFLGKDGLRHRC